MQFCPLYSGSSGNALFLEAGGVRLLVDAGLSGITIERALHSIGVSPDTLSAILVTHEHSDHIKGVGILSRKYDLPVYANLACWEAMLPQLGEIRPARMRVFETGQDFYLKGLNITPFATPHDSVEPVGYAFFHQGRKLCTMTDIGYMSESLLDAAQDADLLLLEANHDVEMLKNGAYPYPLKKRILSSKGHLSNADAGRALTKLYSRGVRNVILGHLSAHNNTEAIAMQTVQSCLVAEDIFDGMHIAMAHRDRPLGVFVIE